MNKIEISGKITKEPVLSHENHGEKFYSTQITSVRTSGVPDTLNVTFSEISFTVAGYTLSTCGFNVA